jgi:hypothetical protein
MSNEANHASCVAVTVVALKVETFGQVQYWLAGPVQCRERLPSRGGINGGCAADEFFDLTRKARRYAGPGIHESRVYHQLEIGSAAWTANSAKSSCHR